MTGMNEDRTRVNINEEQTNQHTMARISDLLSAASGKDRHFPPTDLFNEGWMLRLILDWFSHNRGVVHELNFADSARWYCEALLPSAFLRNGKNGKKLAESHTHADGVIGHFKIGETGIGDLFLPQDARQFVVTEAKMYSKLSPRVTNAAYFNQAARNVACMAKVISRAKVAPTSFDVLAFYVLAPQSRIEADIFKREMQPESISEMVKQRVEEYEDDEYREWFSEWFLPFLNRIKIDTIAWEDIIEFIASVDQDFGTALDSFYQLCDEFNQSVATKYG